MSLITNDMERSEEIWLNRSANRPTNVARHVPRRIDRDVTPDFLLASNRHTAKFAEDLARVFGAI